MCQCQNKPILVPFLLLQKVHGEKDFSAVPAWTSLAAAHSCGGSQVCQALHSPGTGLGTKWPPVHRTIHGPGSRLAPARPVGPYYYTLASQWYESCQKLLPLHNILNIKDTSKYTLALRRKVSLWGNIVKNTSLVWSKLFVVTRATFWPSMRLHTGLRIVCSQLLMSCSQSLSVFAQLPPRSSAPLSR